MPELILFGTEGCHLCEEALFLLTEVGINFKVLDIMDKPEWQERFGMIIPVLWDNQSSNALSWPFEAKQILEFYQAIITT